MTDKPKGCVVRIVTVPCADSFLLSVMYLYVIHRAIQNRQITPAEVSGDGSYYMGCRTESIV